MSKRKMAAGPVCTWIPVTDESGRTHMEARWTLTPVAVRSAA